MLDEPLEQLSVQRYQQALRTFQTLLCWMSLLNMNRSRPPLATSSVFQTLLCWMSLLNKAGPKRRWQCVECQKNVSNLVVLDEPLELLAGSASNAVSSQVSNLVVLDEPLERERHGREGSGPGRFQTLLCWMSLLNRSRTRTRTRSNPKFQTLLCWMSLLNPGTATAIALTDNVSNLVVLDEPLELARARST